MSISIPDLAVQRDALLGQRLDAGELERWTRELVEAVALTTALQLDVRVGNLPIEWSVEARLAGRPVLLVDVGTDGLGQATLDRLELRAAHVWRDLTRDASSFEPRPWIGAIRVMEENAIEVVGVERIQRLVASRTLDAACVVVLDRPARTVESPSPVMLIESFAAALIGRCLVLAAGASALQIDRSWRAEPTDGSPGSSALQGDRSPPQC